MAVSNKTDGELFWSLDKELRFGGRLEIDNDSFTLWDRHGNPFYGDSLQDVMHKFEVSKIETGIFEIPS